MIRKLLFICVVFLIVTRIVDAQSSTCGVQILFVQEQHIISRQLQAEHRPNQVLITDAFIHSPSCLYFMQVQNSGNITILMHSVPNYDIDLHAGAHLLLLRHPVFHN